MRRVGDGRLMIGVNLTHHQSGARDGGDRGLGETGTVGCDDVHDPTAPGVLGRPYPD